MAAKLIDLTGQRFGRWYVSHRIEKSAPPRWWCICDCGTERAVKGSYLREGSSQSCRCLCGEKGAAAIRNRPENSATRAAKKRHGSDWISRHDPWYLRACGIRNRARAAGIDFEFPSIMAAASYFKALTPEFCPVFGFKLVEGTAGFNPYSPSVDRINSARGYEHNNVQVISLKANTMKSNADIDDLQAFARWVLSESPKWPR